MKRLRRRLQHMILCSILSFRMNYAHSSDESDIYLHPPEKKNDIPPDCFPRSAPHSRSVHSGTRKHILTVFRQCFRLRTASNPASPG